MIVSRETFNSRLAGLVADPGVAGATLSALDLLPLVLPLWPGACLVVEDSHFEPVFNILYKHSFSQLVVLTNRASSSPSGFMSSLDRYKNNASLLAEDFSGLVLIDKSTYLSGEVGMFCKAESYTVNQSSRYDVLISKLEDAGFCRTPTVSSVGDFSVRGAVVDFFSSEAPKPVRVDFSFDVVNIYLFNVVSQITVKKIPHMSFVVSLGGEKTTSLPSVLGSFELLSLSSLNLRWRDSASKFISISSCYFDDYRSFKNTAIVDSSLSSFGLFCNNKLFVPESFGLNPKPESNNAALSVFDDAQGFSVGDYLIHEDYGVGRLSNILSGEDGEGSLLQIAYLDATVSVHLSQINLISFFAKGGAPGISIASISKKGLWSRKKQSLSEKIDLFVRSLYDQHFKRMSSTKKRAHVDLAHLSDFVESFMFVDTPDQSSAFKDILKDLSSPVPMDRLLCGDVGFGKTEIAIRAAFIAANQGSPVVVLCPTTVLCHQLTASFKNRLSAFSINVSSVSRLSPTSLVEDAVSGFNSKKVDVLVCTHRIFSYLDRIKGVGLLVVDEEHRFGVKQKNIFLNSFPNIDLLMMSATPIPRTLQSALSGIKTISTITTPPVDRLPIETSVEFFNFEKVRDYIGFEVLRGGQVYFLHNNISSLNKFKRQLSSLIKGLRVVVIHAKMSPLKIKEVLGSFVSKEFDVLVSTSIIENGLDIPNVNTVIINNAHLFGLSQLHQIRGRVGRHNRQAYAHLLIPKNSQPTGDTFRRLKAIEQNISLGSGYVLSTKDLEIRGAGSVFGYSQSGGAQVGFDYYNKLLQRAISSNDLDLCFDQVSVDLFGERVAVPSSYVEDVGVRISIYRKLLSIDNSVDLKSYEGVLSNRFGAIPKPLSLLLGCQEIRILCYSVFVLSISFSGGVCSVVFLPSRLLENVSSFFEGVSSFFNNKNVNYRFQKLANDRLLLSFDWKDKNKDILVFIRDFLNKFRNEFLN